MRKKYLIAAMAIMALSALVAAGTAGARGPGNNLSGLDVEFNPETVSASQPSKGGLFIETTTTDSTDAGTPTSPGVQPDGVDDVQIDFDDSITITRSTVPECSVSLIGLTTQAAMKACGQAHLGGGSATLCAGGGGGPCSYATNNTFQAVVTAFRGPGTTILLHGRNDEASNTTILTADVKNSPPGLPEDYGKRVDVPVGPILGGAASITDFTVNINNGNFIRATCDDGDTTWHYRAFFDYTAPEANDTVTDTQTCTPA